MKIGLECNLSVQTAVFTDVSPSSAFASVFVHLKTAAENSGLPCLGGFRLNWFKTSSKSTSDLLYRTQQNHGKTIFE